MNKTTKKRDRQEPRATTEMMFGKDAPRHRYWELDSLRGIAIMMMIIFHMAYDLDYFGGANLRIHQGFWWFFARLIALLFITLVGISLSISVARTAHHLSATARHRKYVRRGLTLLGWGLLITIITWALVPEGTIVFGVLHFIGVGIILAHPLVFFPRLQLILAGVCLMGGVFLQSVTVQTPLLLWVGLRPDRFYTFDYFPLVPWFGIICLGMFAGTRLYPDGIRRWPMAEWSHRPLVRQLAMLGKRSLFIYLIHQPVLMGILVASGIITLGP